MSIVVNKKDFRIIENANTPDFMDGNWLINPIIPKIESRYWKLVNETLEEMTQLEKDEVIYSTESTIYLIKEKQLLTKQNGNDYKLNINAIINPLMPQGDIKYTNVSGNAVVKMTIAEKLVVDQPEIDRVNSKTDVSTLYIQAITDLKTIQNETNPTYTQILWAVKTEALILERLLKFIKLNQM